MTQDEQEILDFYRTGSSIKDLAYSYGYSIYMIKKFLTNEPSMQPFGYIWRELFPSKQE